MQKAKVTLGFDWDVNEAIPGVKKEEHRKMAEEVSGQSAVNGVVHRTKTDLQLTQDYTLRQLGDFERITLLASRIKMRSKGLLRW